MDHAMKIFMDDSFLLLLIKGCKDNKQLPVDNWQLRFLESV